MHISQQRTFLEVSRCAIVTGIGAIITACYGKNIPKNRHKTFVQFQQTAQREHRYLTTRRLQLGWFDKTSNEGAWSCAILQHSPIANAQDQITAPVQYRWLHRNIPITQTRKHSEQLSYHRIQFNVAWIPLYGVVNTVCVFPTWVCYVVVPGPWK